MATTVKEVLDDLPDEDKRLLNFALEMEITQFIALKGPDGQPDGRYIGVNCERIGHLSPKFRAGVWSVGTIN